MNPILLLFKFSREGVGVSTLFSRHVHPKNYM